jgi:uncharacterized protein (TIGR02145 family)
MKPQYESVKIGDQEWMPINLDVDRFRNGDLIPHVESDEEWEKAGENEQAAWCYYDNDPENGKKYGKLYNWFAVNDPRGLAPEGWHVPSKEEWEEAGENGQPAWCYYDNDPENGEKYGKLYNWFAVNDPRGLALEGWHVPTDDEWTTLINYLGGEDIAGLKMKSIERWDNWYNQDGEIINGNNSNSSGLNIIPGGNRFPGGRFVNIRNLASFWSATKSDLNYAWNCDLNFFNGVVIRSSNNKTFGASIRCLRDDFLSI